MLKKGVDSTGRTIGVKGAGNGTAEVATAEASDGGVVVEDEMEVTNEVGNEAADVSAAEEVRAANGVASPVDVGVGMSVEVENMVSVRGGLCGAE